MTHSWPLSSSTPTQNSPRSPGQIRSPQPFPHLAVRLTEPLPGTQGLTLATRWGCSFSSVSFLTPAQSPEHTNGCHWPFPPRPLT